MSKFVDGHFHSRTSFAKRGGNRLGARARFDYNNRLGRWEKKHEGPLAFSVSGNMPSWATAPRDFWEAADKFERANGCLYFHTEFAIPLDLKTREQQYAAAMEYARQIAGDKHPFTLTMHNNQGNPHCDLQWSTSAFDGIERSPELFFKRAASRGEDPARGGCRKVNYTKKDIVAMRAAWADVANRHLEAAGSNVRIDHRSYKERGISKAPGVHLGQKAHRLEKSGKATMRSVRNKERTHLNASLREVQSHIHQKEKPNEQRPGRHGRSPQQPTHTRRRSAGAAGQRAFERWHDSPGDRPGLRSSRRAGPERMPVLREQGVGAGQQEARNAVLQRAVSGPGGRDRGLHSVSGGGVYTVETLDRRQLYKARLLQQQYRQEIQTALAARLAYVDRQPDRIAITLKGGGRLTDHGDRLLTKAGRDQEILAAIALCRVKGWRQIQITGTEAFKARAYIEAIRAGLAVVGYAPSPELRAQLEKEKTMTDQAGAGGMMSLAPDSISPQASTKQRWEDALRAAIGKVEERKKAARVSELFQIEQDRKALAHWLDTAQRRHIDDLLWEVAHHEAEDKTKSAALVPFYQMRATEAETIKREREEQRQEQLLRELAAQQQVDAIQDQFGKPGLTADQKEELEQQQRYHQAIAAGHDEEEAKERAAKKSDALRL